MNNITLSQYLNDLNENNIYNANMNISNNKNLKDLIVFFISNKIKFYFKHNNSIIIKNIEQITNEIKNVRNNEINNLIIKLIKYSSDKLIYINDELINLILFLNNIGNILILLNNNYNKLISIFVCNNKELDFIARYNNT